jgi:putative ABC transport system permease protein
MGDRLFRALLKLLPSEFRGEYAGELERTFRTERADVHSRVGLLRLWMTTVADVFRTAPAEHVDLLRRDLRYALRMLGRRPGVAFTAIVTLALGIGTNTAIFSVVQGVLLAPLPYLDPDRLVRLFEESSTTPHFPMAPLDFRDYRAELRTFEGLAAYMRADL